MLGLNNKGFTIQEIVLTLILIVIFSVITFPKSYQITQEAHASHVNQVTSSLSVGIQLWSTQTYVHTHEIVYPEALDEAKNGLCSNANPCFNTVLTHPMNNGSWKKKNNTYEYIKTGDIYEYKPVTGEFASLYKATGPGKGKGYDKGEKTGIEEGKADPPGLGSDTTAAAVKINK